MLLVLLVPAAVLAEVKVLFCEGTAFVSIGLVAPLPPREGVARERV